MSSTGSRRPTVTRPRIPDVETVPSALRRTADLHGDVEAVVDRDARLTYVQLRREVEDVSAALFARDLRSGDVVAIWAPNWSRWALTALACMNVGITLVPVNTRYKAEEADAVLERSGASMVFVEDGFLGVDYSSMVMSNASSTRPPRSSRSAPSNAWGSLLAAAGDVDRAAVESASGLVAPGTRTQVMFTSGTTGAAKAVPLTHGQAVGLYSAYSANLGLRAGDRYILVNPFFHSFGLLAGLLSCILRVATAIPVPRLARPMSSP
ncbi:hypothetical protein GCM10009836_24770 [Pseudonocardia ailaonensis]|uniref:AMP-dependent synthetase/ligase domain-containing protein n=1 Tax=Pseudonocardia ailaonensis TaxID=367279 RepID=A0ABN2MZT8_9PSEU